MGLEKKEIVINDDFPEPNIEGALESPRDIYIAMVLDSSGSMMELTNQVIESVNSFIANQAAVPAETIVTLCDFNSVVNFPFQNVNIKDIDTLTRENYRPSGSTALYDAIMQTKDVVENYLNSSPGLDVIFVIITDGEENASHMNNRQNVFDMIREKTEQGWVFTYLSADADAFQTAASLGVASANTVQWALTTTAFNAGTDASNLATTSWRYSNSDASSYSLSSAAVTVMASSNLDPGALKVSPDNTTATVKPPKKKSKTV